jgi:hypothetical protein
MLCKKGILMGIASEDSARICGYDISPITVDFFTCLPGEPEADRINNGMHQKLKLKKGETQ